jgi:hypothetical protein
MRCTPIDATLLEGPIRLFARSTRWRRTESRAIPNWRRATDHFSPVETIKYRVQRDTTIGCASGTAGKLSWGFGHAAVPVSRTLRGSTTEAAKIAPRPQNRVPDCGRSRLTGCGPFNDSSNAKVMLGQYQMVDQMPIHGRDAA